MITLVFLISFQFQVHHGKLELQDNLPTFIEQLPSMAACQHMLKLHPKESKDWECISVDTLPKNDTDVYFIPDYRDLT
jgi:hypothetical protein